MSRRGASAPHAAVVGLAPGRGHMQSVTWDALEALVSKAHSMSDLYEVPVIDELCGSHLQLGLLLVTLAASVLALFWARAAAHSIPRSCRSACGSL